MTESLPPKRVSTNTGLNILELGDASPQQVTLVRLVLKKVNVTTAELWQRVQELPEKRRMTREAFNEALEQLVISKWLWKTGSGESARYSPRLKKTISRARVRFSLDATGASTASLWKIWALLAQRAAEEQVSATSATPTLPQIGSRLRDFLSTRLEAGQLIFGLLLVLSAVNSFAMASIEVTGVSGFVQSVGAQNLPWLTIAEMVLGLSISAGYIQIADRLPRLRLMKIMTTVLVAVYLITAGLFAAATSTHLLDGLAAAVDLEAEALIYPLLYLIRSQQVILFPIAFWNLANSIYSMAEARKVFPAIASGETLGGLIGYALFAGFFGLPALFDSHDAPILLAFSATMYLLCLIVMNVAVKEPASEVDDDQETFLSNLKEGWETIRSVPLFRYLAISVTLVWLTFPLLEYHFYTSLDNASEQGLKFETFFSMFSIANTLLTLLLQWRLTEAVAKRVTTRSAFIALPATLALGALAALLFGNLYVAAGAVLAAYVIYASWDAPMLNTLQNLIPEERRARVSTLLSNYSYAVGKIVGSLVLGLILLIKPDSGTLLSYIYLPVALVAATIGVIATVMVRRTYEQSLLSWRIARRQRASSVLDKLDF